MKVKIKGEIEAYQFTGDNFDVFENISNTKGYIEVEYEGEFDKDGYFSPDTLKPTGVKIHCDDEISNLKIGDWIVFLPYGLREYIIIYSDEDFKKSFDILGD